MTLEWWQALLLGGVQGATEFLPVSSSGHLVLVPFLLGWPSPGLGFDAVVHGGTAGALVAVFRRELAALARGLTGGGDDDARFARRLAGLVVVGSLPLVIVGATVSAAVEAAFAFPPAAATGLIGSAAILLGGEWWRSRRARAAARPAAGEGPVWTGSWVGPVDAGEPAAGSADATGAASPVRPSLPLGADSTDPAGASLDQLTARTALVIGVAQAIAVLPGVSRSGTTIMTGVATGLTREAATRFAFLLALPALAGATLLSATTLVREGAGTLGWPSLAGAIAVAFVVGLAAIRWLLGLVARTPLRGFAVYCAAAGLTGWVAILMFGTGIAGL